jgi:hypothetical protein
MNPILEASLLRSLTAGVIDGFGGDGTIGGVPVPARE